LNDDKDVLQHMTLLCL